MGKYNIFLGMILYGDLKDIIEKINLNYDQNYVIYIHINKLQKKDVKTLKNIFKSKSNIHIFTKYKVYWGEQSIINTQLFLMKICLKEKCDFFVCLDNRSFIVKKLTINDFNANINYLNLNFEDNNEIHSKKQLKEMEARDKLFNNYRYRFLHDERRFKMNNFFKKINLLYLKYFNIFLHNKSKDLTAIPNKVKSELFFFKYRITSGATIVLNKNEIKILFKSKKFKKLLNISKYIAAPEEWLIINFFRIYHYNKNSKNIIFSTSSVKSECSNKNILIYRFPVHEYNRYLNKNNI